MGVFEQSGCIRAKVVVFGQKWLYTGKSGFIWAKCLNLGKYGCVRERSLHSGNDVVFG